VWEGHVCGLAVEAALEDPRRVPVPLFLPEVRARYVRVRLFDTLMVEDVQVFRPAPSPELLPEPEKVPPGRPSATRTPTSAHAAAKRIACGPPRGPGPLVPRGCGSNARP
jgi:hypothetical protein